MRKTCRYKAKFNEVCGKSLFRLIKYTILQYRMYSAQMIQSLSQTYAQAQMITYYQHILDT